MDGRAVLDEALRRHRAGDLAGAEALYRGLIEAEEDVAALVNLSVVLRERGRADEALELLRRAARRDPSSPYVHRNRGNLLRDLGDAEGAAEAYEATLRLNPADEQAAVDLARVRLAQGRFAQAWPLMERRPERAKAAARLPFPEWRGEPLRGRRLLVWPEQGFGDQIMMARFVARLDAQVTLVCLPDLAGLFASLPATVVPTSDRLALPPQDFWTLPLSLPALLGSCADLATAPYLAAEPSPGPGRVGVAWRGNARPDPGRSLPPELGAALLALPGAVSLHPEDTGARDFRQTAERIAALDLVISVDTSVAHLAAAMGKPTWVLLQHAVIEWRWAADAGGRSWWYPQATVLRQPTPGDWRAVVDRIRADWPVRD